MIKYIVKINNTSTEFTDKDLALNFQSINGGNFHQIDEPESLLKKPCREIPMWRVRSVLQGMGLIIQIEQILNSINEPQKSVALIAWNYGNTILSDSNIVCYLQQCLNLTDKQVNDIFDLAEGIQI